MPAYPVRQFGDPVLKQRAKEVEELDADVARLTDTMYATMYEAVGVGLAAPQIGVQRRIFTYDIGDGPHVLVNPIVVAQSGEAAFEEGCLSLRGVSFEIVRPQSVTVQAVDLDGREVVLEDDGYLARVLQHEIDHLDGVLVIDRVDPDTRKRALRTMREADVAGAVVGRSHEGPARL